MNKIISIGIIVLAVAGLFVYTYITVPKIAYVNIDVVYEEFTLKKELEKKLQNVERERNLQLDSLKTELQILSTKIEAERGKNLDNLSTFHVKKERYLQKEDEFMKANQALADEYRAQIWKQLKQYIKDYSKNKGYDFIYGVDDGYNFIYVNESDDITDKLKEFVNNKYNGSSK